MKNISNNNAAFREKIKKGLDLTFQKLLKIKRANNGVFVFSENGVIKKIKATDIVE